MPGPRIKTTIRTGQAHLPAVRVVASGRVLTTAESPRSNSACPTAKFAGPQAKSPSPTASDSGTTVTLAASGSPTSSAVDSIPVATGEQTAELDCSEKLGTASLPDQSPIFLQSPGAYTDSNAPQSPGMASVQSPQAAMQISASEALNPVAANEHHLVAVNPSTAMLMAASEAQHAAAAAAGESDGAEAVQEWAPDEEAVQAASALAGLAESNWAGKAALHCKHCTW